MNASRQPRIAVVYNPAKVERRELQLHIERYGDVTWYETTPDDPGFAQADRAVEEGADIVIAAGGDGTVRMVALALSGSPAALGIVPAGTGNLLARNLGIPLTVGAAVERAFTGSTRLIDLCRAELTYPDGGTEHSAFAVMAGVGVDAGMIHYTDDQWKARIGAAAYVPAVFRSLGGGNRIDMSFSLDDAPPTPTSVHTCIIGNCGDLIGNIPLLPAAEPDDGLLDAVFMRPQHAASWGSIGAKLVADSARKSLSELPNSRLRPLDPLPTPDSLDYAQARRIVMDFAEPEPLELDGDDAGLVSRAAIDIIPGTLNVIC